MFCFLVPAQKTLRYTTLNIFNGFRFFTALKHYATSSIFLLYFCNGRNLCVLTLSCLFTHRGPLNAYCCWPWMERSLGLCFMTHQKGPRYDCSWHFSQHRQFLLCIVYGHHLSHLKCFVILIIATLTCDIYISKQLCRKTFQIQSNREV